MNLEWQRNDKGLWPELSELRPSTAQAGVYIIWHGGSDPGIVSVGSGNIALALKAQGETKTAHSFAKQRLYIGWAPADENTRAGIVRYLTDRLKPKSGVSTGKAEAIPVNLPWRAKQH